MAGNKGGEGHSSELGKRIRAESYRERLSEPRTWREGPHSAQREAQKGSKWLNAEAKRKQSPSLSPAPSSAPLGHASSPLPGPPPPGPSFLTWLLLPFPRECLQACLPCATRYCQSPGEGQRAQGRSQIMAHSPRGTRQTLTSPASPHTQSLNKIDPLSSQWVW